MSKTVYDLTNYEDLKAQYEDSQRQLKQTEQLLIHLTQIIVNWHFVIFVREK